LQDVPHETLVTHASQGDAEAMDALLERHLPGLRAYVRLHAGPLLRQRESCSDLAQSVCREVLQAMRGFEYRGEAPFCKWLYQKALSKLQMRQRYYLADKRSPARERALADEGGTQLREIYASICSPSQVAIRNEDLALLEATFDQLPDDYRKVISLAHIVGLAHAEIAEEMGRSEIAVRSLLHRALARLGWLLHRAE
jgi:RNA polymerase sigma-70 factor (ECF subfamily)